MSSQVPQLRAWPIRLVMLAKTKAYICEIGQNTENLAKCGLALTLMKEGVEFLSSGRAELPILQLAGYEEARGLSKENAALSAYKKWNVFKQYAEHVGGRDPGEAATELAAATGNAIFGETESRPFAEEYAIALGYDDALCSILSRAAYNGCYARYLYAGGTTNPFSNPFLEFVGSMSGIYTADPQRRIKVQNRLRNAALMPRVLAPLDAMSSAGIFRPLPSNPNEREFYETVLRFAIEAGVDVK